MIDEDVVVSGNVRIWSAEGPPAWTLYGGAADEALGLIEPESVDCVVTSPPYFWLRDYGASGQIGLEGSVGEYVDAVAGVMDGVKRVLRPSGTVFLVLGDTYYSGRGMSRGVDRKNRKRRFGMRAVDESGGMGMGLQRKSLMGMPWRVAMALSERGWTLRSEIIWVRESALGECVRDRPSRSYERIFLLVRSSDYYFSRDGLLEGEPEDVWRISARPRPGAVRDSAPFPDALVARCLDVGCPPGGTVLDPFCGSGTAMRVALERSQPAVGIELNPEFCRHVRRMLGAIGPRLFP